MNEEEMIEEMAKTLYDYRFSYDDCIAGSEEDIAEYLIKQGYCKILEGSVVLTKEEYSDYLILQTNHEFIRERAKELQADNERLYKNLGKFKESVEKETLGKIKLIPIECGEECGHYYLDISVTGKELLQRVYFNSAFIDGKVRKETAKEIIELIDEIEKNNPNGWIGALHTKQAIAKQCGVEE